MTTLHKVTEATKKVIIGFTIGIASIVFLIFLIRVLGNIKEALFPTPPTPPTMSFGKLPQLVFPQNDTTGTLSYSLNTVTGTLPNLPDRATVYKIQQPQANLLSFNNTQQLVAQNGFSSNPTTISDTQYKWQQANAPFLGLTYDVVTHNFFASSNFTSDAAVLAALHLPSQDKAIEVAKGYLTNFSSFPEDIDETKTVTHLFDIQNNALIPATSLSITKVIQVNFFQKNINNLPIVYPNIPNSSIQVLIASGQTDPQAVGVQFSHQTTLTDQNATYPIKTALQAFNELKNNQAYISYKGTGNTIVIKNIYLAYYIGQTTQAYTMPVIVFQGDNNFYAFVSAVTNAQIGK